MTSKQKLDLTSILPSQVWEDINNTFNPKQAKHLFSSNSLLQESYLESVIKIIKNNSLVILDDYYFRFIHGYLDIVSTDKDYKFVTGFRMNESTDSLDSVSPLIRVDSPDSLTVQIDGEYWYPAWVLNSLIPRGFVKAKVDEFLGKDHDVSNCMVIIDKIVYDPIVGEIININIFDAFSPDNFSRRKNDI